MTKFIPHTALPLISSGKMTFADRLVVHLVDWSATCVIAWLMNIKWLVGKHVHTWARGLVPN